jgi:hypothetical protein
MNVLFSQSYVFVILDLCSIFANASRFACEIFFAYLAIQSAANFSMMSCVHVCLE